MKTGRFVVLWVLLILAGCMWGGFAAAENITGGEKIITDIAHWNHPVKAVFQQYRIAIYKLILQKGNTYPVFYVRFPERYNQNTVKQFRAIFEKVAIANAFWDYKLMDEQQNLTLEVICNRKEKSLKNVVVNHDTQTYQRLLTQATDREFERALGYLRKKVPEIESYFKMIAEGAKQSKEKVTSILRLDGEPDPGNSNVYLRDYYAIYVGENHDDHTVRWKTFLVKKDLTAILVDDVLTGDYLTLEDWRKKDPREQ